MLKNGIIVISFIACFGMGWLYLTGQKEAKQLQVENKQQQVALQKEKETKEFYRDEATTLKEKKKAIQQAAPTEAASIIAAKNKAVLDAFFTYHSLSERSAALTSLTTLSYQEKMGKEQGDEDTLQSEVASRLEGVTVYEGALKDDTMATWNDVKATVTTEGRSEVVHMGVLLQYVNQNGNWVVSNATFQQLP